MLDWGKKRKKGRSSEGEERIYEGGEIIDRKILAWLGRKKTLPIIAIAR